MKINIHRECDISPTQRTELLGSMFEIPTKQKLSVTLTGEIPLENKGYNIGLIVGPSGSGKTILLNDLFGVPCKFEWNSRSIIDDFAKCLSMEDISRVCQSVGFNTIPSWLRPYSVLSNGERFRAEVARHLLESPQTITIDEFSSVVDRQVAQFACHGIQKYVREKDLNLVVASCHYDIIEWLQPDWILEPGNPCRFTWRSLQGRPSIDVAVQRVKYKTWSLFRDFHYMSQDLNKAARCYGLYVKFSELSTRMDVRIHDENVRTFTDRCYDNSGVSEGLRISSEFAVRQSERNNSVVFQSDNANETEESSESRIHESSDALRSDSASDLFRQRDSRMRAVTSGSRDASESGCELSKEEATAVMGQTGPTETPEYESVLRSRNHGETLRPDNSGRFPRGHENSLVPPSQTYRIASMCGILYRPHPRVSDIYGFSRMVTLPDFQGLGLAFVLACKLGSAYKALGKRLHSYPNHPAWIRSYQRSKDWLQVKEAGNYSPRAGTSSSVGGFGGRRCAVFLYIGDAMNREEAERLIHVEAE